MVVVDATFIIPMHATAMDLQATKKTKMVLNSLVLAGNETYQTPIQLRLSPKSKIIRKKRSLVQ